MNSNLKDFKFSNYNHKIKLDGNTYVYNALSGGFAKLNSDINDVIKEIDLRKNEGLKVLETLPDNIINEFKNGGFLVHKDLDEFKFIKTQHNMLRYSGKNSLNLTILPTLGCNFRCTYCFEKDGGYLNNDMSEEVMDAIIKLIEDKLSDKGYLNITWFGGEPLMKLDTIRILQRRILDIVDRKNLTLFSGIITNGYLLSEDVSNELSDLKINAVQITIDGPKCVHDKKRMLSNGKGTFDKIIENILSSNKNLDITIRVNIEKDNISSISELINYLNDVGISNLSNVRPYFAVVKDYSEESNVNSDQFLTATEFAKEEINLNRMLYEKGINTDTNMLPNLGVCGAISPNAYLIEPDGALKKCWSTVGKKDSIVGHILNTDIDKHTCLKNETEWYAWSKFESDGCKNCSILPLCMGGCPYNTINDCFSEKNKSYMCNTLKFNLDDTLKLIAYKHIQKSQRKEVVSTSL